MKKKPFSVSDLGDIRKPERQEIPHIAKEESTAKKGRGRPKRGQPLAQLNTRVQVDIIQKVDEIVERKGWTIREVVEEAIKQLHNKC